ncbi:DUF4367 domain-containing protein [Oscillibacter sp.]|uniref:DUF4367 domain-containing protein n=1 Tax=Oscillibacter sp. TaxID=1945593 RepID=UPI0026258185|nr:DUF4367 domain-containing protein [Oscillibacter sp.]MDD3346881.1 DUF4367 domain-containing protein [Oscillibacter sp.]
MNEAVFDAKLKDALLRAAIVDFAEALSAPEEEPEWTLSYRRSRRKMLSGPDQWYKNKRKPVWKKMLQSVACLLLAVSLTLGTLMAASPTVRAAVLNWLREFIEYAVIYRGVEAPRPIPPEILDSGEGKSTETSTVEAPSSFAEIIQSAQEDASTVNSSQGVDTTVRVYLGEDENAYVDIPVQSNPDCFDTAPAWAPTWVPDGWGIKKIQSTGDDNGACDWLYQSGSGMLTYTCSQASKSTRIIAGLTENDCQRVSVSGAGADYYENGGYTYLLWESNDCFYSLESGPYISPSKEALIKMAESVQKLDVISKYVLNWTPVGSRSVERHDVPGATWEEFVDGDNWYFCFTYASNDAGSLYTQGINTKKVCIDGCTGTYWEAKKERDATYGGTETVTFDDGSTEICHVVSGGQIATIIWTNSDGVSFSIRGAFDEETLLHMAESVIKTT